MFRKLAVASLIAFSLVGCSTPSDPIAESVAAIREGAPALAHNSDEELTSLMRKACSVLDESDGNILAFVFLSMEYDLDPHDVGVVAGNAIKTMCPEHDPNK